MASDPALRGRGPKKGAPNAGRPPSAIRQAYREAFDARMTVATTIADDATAAPGDRLRALDLLGKYGLGSTTTLTDAQGQDARTAVVLLPALGES